ncbi:MAG: glycosyltransferase family 1 protein [Bacteroidota bacterium]
MRIGIEAQRLFRARKHGMDIVALELLRRLPTLATEHEFVAFVRPGEDRCLTSRDNLEVVEVEARSYPSWEQVALPRAAAEAGVDLLHCTANTAPLRSPVPVVLTLHDIIFLEGGSPLLRGGTAYQRLGNQYRRATVPGAVRRAARVTTVSRYEAGRIAERFPEVANRLDVVSNAVGEHFAPVSDPVRLAEARGRYGLPSRFAFLLGNTDPKKNIPGAVEAYVRYAREAEAPVPLVVADLAPEALDAHLRTLGAMDLRDLFVLPGYVAHADLPAVYTLCDAFLYPSLRESFGLPILEAMASGAPVLTSDAASMPEVAGDAALLVDPRQPAEIAGALARLLTDTPLRRSLRETGRQRAAAFSWDRAAEEMLAVYRSVLHPARLGAEAEEVETVVAV